MDDARDVLDMMYFPSIDGQGIIFDIVGVSKEVVYDENTKRHVFKDDPDKGDSHLFTLEVFKKAIVKLGLEVVRDYELVSKETCVLYGVGIDENSAEVHFESDDFEDEESCVKDYIFICLTDNRGNIIMERDVENFKEKTKGIDFFDLVE